jgi:molecular chaperone GrpE
VPADEDPDFDAVAAVKELEDALGAASPVVAPRDDEYDAVLEAEIEQLTSLLAQKDELLRRADQRADQAHAEIAAVRRRLEAEASRELERKSRELVTSFLFVVDDLDRAIAAAKQHEHSPDVIAGIELVRRELLGRLGQLGVAHAPALGEPFDPVRHEAMALVPVSDPAQDGRVVGVIREGYTIHDDTLRPAGVAVGKLG